MYTYCQIMYLPTAEIIKLPSGCHFDTRHELERFLNINECYLRSDGTFRFLTYDEFLIDAKPSGKVVPRHLFEIIDVPNNLPPNS